MCKRREGKWKTEKAGQENCHVMGNAAVQCWKDWGLGQGWGGWEWDKKLWPDIGAVCVNWLESQSSEWEKPLESGRIY